MEELWSAFACPTWLEAKAKIVKVKKEKGTKAKAKAKAKAKSKPKAEAKTKAKSNWIKRRSPMMNMTLPYLTSKLVYVVPESKLNFGDLL